MNEENDKFSNDSKRDVVFDIQTAKYQYMPLEMLEKYLSNEEIAPEKRAEIEKMIEKRKHGS